MSVVMNLCMYAGRTVELFSLSTADPGHASEKKASRTTVDPSTGAVERVEI